jgi:regulator of sigma E protease
MIITIIVFVVILGLLIFVHELGHFVVAQRNGICAPEFGFGFPPRMFGIQILRGQKKEIITKSESISIAASEKEFSASDEIFEIDRITPVKKWRFIWGSKDGDDEYEKRDKKEINREGYETGTIYSLNWIPIGGFVKIKGENGDHKNEPDSFASKSPWVRSKVLFAGVLMNFILAWFLYSLGYMIGSPEGSDSGDMIQISRVVENSPASEMGLKPGDEILKIQSGLDGQSINLSQISDVQKFISSSKGREVALKIKRGSEYLDLKGTPRINAPEGQGSLGIEMAEVSIVKFSWYKAIWLGLMKTFGVIALIFSVLFEALRSLVFGQKVVGLEVAGPVKIFNLTSDFAKLGFIYVIQFAAILSINLGIINALPIPALDGGRILFIILEKIKGRPVSQKIEQAFHSAFFALLIFLMIVVTFRDVFQNIK